MQKKFTIIYLSRDGLFERLTTYAENKRQAKKNIRAHLGSYCVRIEEIEEN